MGFFAWQLTHEAEQSDPARDNYWPELYQDSRDFAELKEFLKLACLEYLQQVYDPSLSVIDLAQLELSLWASVNRPVARRGDSVTERMGLAFHDHPLALLSGVFYTQPGSSNIAGRTPTVFADPRGTTAFRYNRRQWQRGRTSAPVQEILEPTAPFHRLAYAHAQEGTAIIF